MLWGKNQCGLEKHRDSEERVGSSPDQHGRGLSSARFYRGSDSRLKREIDRHEQDNHQEAKGQDCRTAWCLRGHGRNLDYLQRQKQHS